MFPILYNALGMIAFGNIQYLLYGACIHVHVEITLIRL